MKIVTKYKAANGKIFDTKQQAQQHEKDLFLKKVDDFIKSWFDSGNAKTNFKAVCDIEKDLSLFKSQIEEMLYIIKHSDSTEEDE